MSTAVPLEALQAELKRLGVPTLSTAGLTAREWASHWQISVHLARKIIADCLANQIMVMQFEYRARPMDGRLNQMPVYTLTVELKAPRPRKRRPGVKKR